MESREYVLHTQVTWGKNTQGNDIKSRKVSTSCLLCNSDKSVNLWQGNRIICGLQRESSLEDSRETLRGLVLTAAGFAPRLELEIDLLSIHGLAEGSFSIISLAAESLSFNFFNSSPRFRATETSLR